MRTLALSAVAVVLGSPVSAQICAPPDSAPLVEWHSKWDRIPPDSLLHFGQIGQSGIFTITYPAEPNVTPQDLALGGSYTLTAHLLQQGSADLVLRGRLRLDAPALTGRRNFRGWLVGPELVRTLTLEQADSLPIYGEVTPDGRAGFRQEFGNEDTGEHVYVDVGGFSVLESTEKGIRGWWAPNGAVVPDWLGYYCAERANF